jgi:predicted metal-dependent hydrolase
MSRRYIGDLQFPAYTYVPGCTPRHAPEALEFGHTLKPSTPGDSLRCREFLVGIDLFNAGYYWEAHEVWESLWHAAGCRGTVADFLKGLIKWAAAGVKCYEGRPQGVRRHAQRAHQLLTGVQRDVSIASDVRDVPITQWLDQIERLVTTELPAKSACEPTPCPGLVGTMELPNERST